MSEEEAHKHAKIIENECLAAADELFMKEPHGDGRSARQLYAAKSGRMMWEVLSGESKTTAEDETADTLFDISSANVSTVGTYGARALLRPLTKPGKSYKGLCFRNRSFGLDAANVAGPVLEKSK